MISLKIIIGVILIVVLLMSINWQWHELRINQMRRDNDSIRLAVEDLQSDIRALDCNMFRMLKEIQELRIAITSIEISKGSIITSSDEHNQDKGTK